MYRVNRFYILIILLRCDERNSTLKTFERIKFHQLSQLFLLASNTRHLPADNGQGTAHPCTACTCPSNSPFSQSSPRTAPPASRSAPSCSHTRAGTLLPLSGRTFPVKIESLNIFEKQASKPYPCKSGIWLRVCHFWRAALCIHPIAMARALLVQDTIVKIRTARQFDFLYAGVYNLVPNHSFLLSRGECVCIINLNPVPSSLSNRCRSVSTTDDVFCT